MTKTRQGGQPFGVLDSGSTTVKLTKGDYESNCLVGYVGGRSMRVIGVGRAAGGG